MLGLKTELKHTILLLVLCIGWFVKMHAQGVSELTTLFTSDKNIQYIGPGFTKDQLILSFPEEIALISISKSRILKTVKVPYLYSVYDVVLFDSINEEIFINPNFETQYLNNFGRLPLWNIKVSFKKDEIQSYLPPDYFLSSGGMHLQSKSTLVHQQWVTVDSQSYWTYRSEVINYDDSLSMEFKKDAISAWSIDQNKRTALGFNSGKLRILNPDYTINYEDTSSKNAITRIEIHNNHLLYTGEGGDIYIVNLATNDKHQIKCLDRILGKFKCLPNSPYLVYQNESGRLCCYNYLTKEKLADYYFLLPALSFNNFTPLDSTSIAVLTIASNSEYHVSRFDFKKLQQNIISSIEAEIASDAVIEEENQRTQMEFITAADTNEIEIIINQNFDYYSDTYLKPAYTDSSASFGLYADGNKAYVFQLSNGNIIKKFNFPLEITEACMHTSGRYVAFSFEFNNSSYTNLDKIVVYDIANKRGKQFETKELLGENSYSHLRNISFDRNADYLVFNPPGNLDTPYNALRWRTGEYEVLKKARPLKHTIDKSKFLESPFAAILLNRSTDFAEFDLHGHILHVESFDGADFDFNLKNLKIESEYDRTFCGRDIYDRSIDNPLWEKLGLKHGEYDFSYYLYPKIANDSIFHFEYKEQWYLVNAKNLEILQQHKDVYVKQLYNYNAHTLLFHLFRRFKTDKDEFLLLDLQSNKSEIVSKEQIEAEIKKNTGYEIKKNYLSNYFFVGVFANKKFIYTDMNSFFVYDAVQNKFMVERTITGSIAEAAEYCEAQNCVYIGCKNGNVFKLNLKTLKTEPFASAGAGIKSLRIAGDKLYVLSEGNSMSVLSLNSGDKLAALFVFEDNTRQSTVAIVTPELYYYSDKEAIDALHISTTGMNVYEMSQFDIVNNRPDKVLRALGFASEATCKIYEDAWKKRLRKLNIDEKSISNAFDLPTIQLVNSSKIPSKTKQESFTFQAHVKAQQAGVTQLRVKINKVPVLGKNGIELPHCKDSVVPVTVELMQGMNEISISAVNAMGVESYSSTINIEYTPNKPRKPNLYLVTLGVSHYADTQYNLKFAAKDARDIQQYFTQNHPKYDSVFTLCFTDSMVTAAALPKIHAFFKQSQREDAVILSFAGHGLLSDNYDYYLASHDINFQKPEVKGIAYDQLENTIEGIQALQRLLLIDACHSGEVDKETLDTRPTNGNVQATLVGRGSNLVVKGNAKQEVSKLASELFTDMRNTTGATVISASGGLEFAMESTDWNNGLFTYCLLNGLQSQSADDNYDSKILVSEMQAYLEEEVFKLSQGLQKPTSRIQNRQSDFPLW